jgi:hypothetical protein
MDEALAHLRACLTILSCLKDKEDTVAYKQALAFYNSKCPKDPLQVTHIGHQLVWVKK